MGWGVPGEVIPDKCVKISEELPTWLQDLDFGSFVESSSQQ